MIAKHTFTFVISADYQQSKLIGGGPNSLAQCITDRFHMMCFDLLITEMTPSVLGSSVKPLPPPKHRSHHRLSVIIPSPSDICMLHHACVFLDNAGSTNRNCYLFSWTMELVRNHTLDHLHFCFFSCTTHQVFQRSAFCFS